MSSIENNGNNGDNGNSGHSTQGLASALGQQRVEVEKQPAELVGAEAGSVISSIDARLDVLEVLEPDDVGSQKLIEKVRKFEDQFRFFMEPNACFETDEPDNDQSYKEMHDSTVHDCYRHLVANCVRHDSGEERLSKEDYEQVAGIKGRELDIEPRGIGDEAQDNAFASLDHELDEAFLEGDKAVGLG